MGFAFSHLKILGKERIVGLSKNYRSLGDRVVETLVSSIFWNLTPWNNRLLLKYRRIEISLQELQIILLKLKAYVPTGYRKRKIPKISHSMWLFGNNF